MRIVFSAVPAAGHILPLLPLIDAARAMGHEVVLLSGSGAREVVPRLAVVEVGPSGAEAMIETERRMHGDDGRHPGDGAVEMFAGVRVESAAGEAIRRISTFDPDLVVSETFDLLGPLVAAALDVPRVEHKIAGPVPRELIAAMQARVESEYRANAIAMSPAALVVDPFPESLVDPDEIDRSIDRIAIRPVAHHVDAAPDRSFANLEDDGPVALVTMGTSVLDGPAISALVESIAALGIRSLVTVEKDTLTIPAALWPLVQELGFVPLAELLPLADVVVSAGGTGTMLASLSEGKPLVIRPFLADQPWNARRAQKSGAAIVIDDFTTAGSAVVDILKSDTHRLAAKSLGERIQKTDDAATVMRELEKRFGHH